MFEYTTFVYPSLSLLTVGCFHLLAIMNNAAVNICVKILRGHMLPIPWDMWLGVELLSYVVTLCLGLEEPAELFSRLEAPFYIFTNSV